MKVTFEGATTYTPIITSKQIGAHIMLTYRL